MNRFAQLYQELKIKFGSADEQWRLWCKRPKTEKEKEEVVIGAILTQRTNWKNVEAAISNLKRAKVSSLKDIYLMGEKSLLPLIRPSGFYQTKSHYLFHLAKFVMEKYGSLPKMQKASTQKLKEKLLRLKGVGPETADSILLYALEKPVFVIDEYTRRWVKKSHLANNFSYHFLQELFEKNLKRDFRLYQDFHALIVTAGKNHR